MFTVFRTTGTVLTALPFMLVPVAIYIFAAAAGTDRMLHAGTLPSGATVGLTLGGGIIFIGIGCLLFEAIKATHTGARGMIDQALSVLLLGAMLVAFLLLPAFGSVTFAILVALQLADVLMGIVIAVKVARRDIGLNA